MSVLGFAIAFAGVSFGPDRAWACACGCSVFDVGGVGGLPQEDDHGGSVFFDFYAANQSQNWVGSKQAPTTLNNDKRVQTNWYAAGIQYSFNRDWGAMVKLLYANRAFTTDDGGTISRFTSNGPGDVELMGMYTGFSKDMSTGITFGVKLPTGVYTANGLDRDTQIGTGSTDLLLGAFHRGMITGDNAWQYFSQVRWQKPLAYRSSTDPDSGLPALYKPGAQIDGAVGVVYNNGYQMLGFDKVAPLLQLIGSHRERDSGDASDPLNSGYDRVFISPGIEFTRVLDEANKRVFKFYADVEIPIYQRTNASPNDSGSQGQLVAPIQFKIRSSYHF